MKNRLKSSFNGNRGLWYGIVGALGLVALLVGIVAFSSAGIGQKTYTADFAQAGGIRPGDKIRVAGIDVGKVDTTELNGNHVTITMKVNRDVVVKDDGSAEIKMSTLLGQRYIDIVLGTSDAAAPDGKIKQTYVPYDLQQTLAKGTPIIAGIKADELTNSIRTLSRQMAGAPAIMGPTLESLTRMSDVLNNRRDQIDQMLKDTDAVTSQVVDTQFQLSIIVGQGAQLANKIVAREQLVTRMLDGLARLTDQASAVAAENRDQFAPVMANLNTMTNGLEKNRANLRKLLEALPIATRQAANIMGDGPYTTGYLPWGLFPDNWLCLAKVVNGC
ncbi:MAG: MCE family protein [Gordonia sp. (in: high G+C Gram-positive bacteria)]|uniref:MCE family protein n=1 Tax=Gordonia sp. (in: high G+C Gram-positive bacteria) TaxID=84139 RepID=UPI003C72F028